MGFLWKILSCIGAKQFQLFGASRDDAVLMSVPIPSITDLRHVSILGHLINEHSDKNNPSHNIEMDKYNINRRKDNCYSQGSDKGNRMAEDTAQHRW